LGKINRGNEMTLDLICVKKILTYINNHEGIINNNELMSFLVDVFESEKKAYGYLKIMKETRLIDCSDHNLGIEWVNDRKCDISDLNIEITFAGQKTLEALKNQDLMARINKGSSEVGFRRLQNIPALTLQAIFEKM
jgi:hypothetical protein